MSKKSSGGALLTIEDISDVATRISEMWSTYNTERRNALTLGEEARRYVYATDMDQTSAAILPHKNRTHQPKLTQISDTLQSQYFEASLSMPEFFRYTAPDKVQQAAGSKLEAWVRAKLEQRKFRETVGRQLVADYVHYGNCFLSVDYITEKSDDGVILYKGPDVRRISPLDLVLNPRSHSFSKSLKIERQLIHVSEIAAFPIVYPTYNFDTEVIQKAMDSRHPEGVDDWVEVIKNRGLNMDGFGGFSGYFKQDLAEILIYRGDVFDPNTGTTQRNRVVYIMDKVHVIRNEPSSSPAGYDGIHHAGWRIRNDNLWAQGPLDNLVGMQYRIDHLENLKADVFDLIAHPALFIKGDEVQEPAGGYAPGAVYYGGIDSDVRYLVPDASALNADNQIAHYHRLMEEWAGAPPEARGIRTPGEKTAFEVSKLDQNATMMFVDKARNFERMLETLLREIFELMLVNYDGADYTNIFDDADGETKLFNLSLQGVPARGEFVAIGARHWTRRNRETLEMQQFMSGPMQDPKIRNHVSGINLASFWERKLNLEDENLVEEFIGVTEDVQAQAVAQSEAERIQESLQSEVGVGDVTGTGSEVPSQQGGQGGNTKPSP